MEIRNLCKSYGDLKVFDNLNLHINEGEITAVMGPSGCGKTTLLNIISNLEDKDGGTIEASDSKALYLFQEPRLLGWKTALENVSIVLESFMDDADERNQRAEEYLGLMRMGDKLNSYPKELSGGQKQRVALARAFCMPSSLLLMDEPMASLDAKLSRAIIEDFLLLFKTSPRTTLFVTHDALEAGLCADEVILLSSSPCRVKERFRVSTGKYTRTITQALAVHDRIIRIFEDV